MRSLSDSTLTLRLDFKNIKNISSTKVSKFDINLQVNDVIEVKLRSEVSFLNPKTIVPYYLPCCIPMTVKIPPQIDAGNTLHSRFI